METDHYEYVSSKIRDHILMRDVFHCTPAELEEIDADEIMFHWAILERLRHEEQRQVNLQSSKAAHGSRKGNHLRP